ncbi:putative secreted protein [Wickerhamomyces ciferrii]|uniref:Secreted protein n=1 Tax=Wickerhamomyces ciferrii (strain ATCC 14091 / BCRC 22168 / CBS 111 / JCM 3599 / NBRC 0793 / NRRL Y-1031 F-60-10) TaxID=1206466 RepID=K0KFW8_WICCF|nr:uncharacterized protein BN7_1345 [Wickerhamomyces ciferrii]CCH41806.1 putative secreted protein [Wickerhamomyces ciferrii]
MKLDWKYITASILLSTSVWAHTEADEKLVDEDLSLPDLAQIESLSTHNWKITGDPKFENGRFILTPNQNSKASLSNDLQVSYDTWTFETIIRSVGSFGKTGSGISIRYVRDHDEKDTSFFGGSGKFDGLNVIIDSNGPTGSTIRGFLNDGSDDLSGKGESLYDQSFGSCLASYQNSQVPFTLRIIYYNNILIVQIDNKICFKTKKINLPKNYKFAISAITNNDHEQFELLRMKTYGGVLSEVLDNENIPATQPKVVTKYVQLDDSGEKVAETTKETLQQEPIHEKFDINDKSLSHLLTNIDKIQLSNKELLENFQNIDNKLTGLSINTKSGKNADLSYLEEYTNKIKNLNEKINNLESKISNFETKIETLERLIRTEINSLTNSITKTNNENINQLRENEQSIHELNKNIQFLVYSEKEKQENPISELVSSLKILIIPILILIIVLIAFTYRLRHDIKTKLL